MIKPKEIQDKQKQVFAIFKKRMKEIGITQKYISSVIYVDEKTMTNYFKSITPMPFIVYLMICDILELDNNLKQKP